VIHARAAAKVFAIDPLTGGSSFRFGFQYLDAGDAEIGRDVVTLNAASAKLDRWVALAANGTVPAGAARVQLISEFVQNAATDGGSVYLDDVSVGFGYVAPSVAVGDKTYTLVWSDEFNGLELNSANWTPEFGTGSNGWGNNEVQSYTSDPQNLRVENGALVIEAHKNGPNWTSARIKTQGKRSFKHGKIEFRAKLPTGVGPWPAAWMMGENISSVGWPNCGEIDVMEWRGTYPNLIGQATHGPSRHGGNPISIETPVANLATAFHTYAVVWEPGKVTFSIDGITTGSWNTADTGNPFEQEFFILLNLAIGGNYLGNQIDPALTTARYEVDYVRVYQVEEAAPLTGYQSYLASLGLPTNLAFDADADGDGIPEGIRYAFGAAGPRMGGSSASLVQQGSALTYTFDFRADPSLSIVPEVSEDLITWGAPGAFTLTDGIGAPPGYVRKVLTVTGAPPNRLFLRLVISN
jgi:beta-glucanase (GH16 family)